MHYIFGDYSLDTRSHELRRHGSLVALQPRAYQVLCYLIKQRDRLVSKHELFDHAWAEVHVGDAALTQCIAVLRKRLGDDRKTQGVIQTQHGKGYRFVDPVRTSPQLSPVTTSERADATEPSQASASTYSTTDADAASTRTDTLPFFKTRHTRPEMAMTERRHLTVLCGMLSDLDLLMSQMDPELWHDETKRWRTAYLDVIAQFDGHVARQLNEGFEVYFGYPCAHEDDTQRAIRTALEMLKRLPYISPTLSQLNISIRVGIHTGMAIAEPASDDTSARTLPVGVTPLLASRLCEQACPGQVLISESTALLVTGYFTWKPLRAQLLLGHAAALSVYKVDGESDFQNRLEVDALSGLTPFVGREAELALMRDRWNQTQQGLGQIISLQGEAGIGKSRLLRVCKESVTEDTSIWLECRCSPYHRNTAFYPLIKLSQHVLSWTIEDSNETHVLAELVDKADGVPLYGEELSRMVLESGQLRETDVRYELRDQLDPQAAAAGHVPTHRPGLESGFSRDDRKPARSYAERGLVSPTANPRREAGTSLLSSSDRDCPATASQVVGATRGLSPRSALAAARQMRCARDLLAPLYNAFSEGFETPLLRNTKALLFDLGEYD